jgi:hypothetical protein
MRSTFRSLLKSALAVLSVSGKLYGTSAHPLVWQRWPYPTVGRPIGSGAGDATKPSNSLIREIVAPLTLGPVQARGCIGEVIATRRSVRVVRRVEVCMMKDGGYA